jgi:hypothetical protein
MELARRVIVAALLVVGAVPAYAAVTEITTCGQTVSGRAVLAQDIDCTGLNAPAITLDGGRLDLAGFTVTGGTRGVNCPRGCQITSSVSGATIRESERGIVGRVIADGFPPSRVSLKISNLTIEDTIEEGVITQNGSIKIFDSTIRNTGVCADAFFRVRFERSTCENAFWGIETGRGPATIIESTITGASGVGIFGQSKIRDSNIVDNPGTGIVIPAGKIRNSTITGNGTAGIEHGFFGHFKGSGKLRIDDSDISNNGIGVRLREHANKLDLSSSTITGNIAQGVWTDTEGFRGADGGERIRIRDSGISGNGLSGISVFVPSECEPVVVSNSTIAGNGLDAAVCGITETCADISVCVPPELSGVTCDTSYDTTSGFPGTSWGVCAVD